MEFCKVYSSLVIRFVYVFYNHNKCFQSRKIFIRRKKVIASGLDCVAVSVNLIS